VSLINVNGKEVEYKKSQIAYNDVVALAYGHDEKRLMSVTYHWRGRNFWATSDRHREGTLRPNGPSTKVQSGMSFNAYHTSGA
jgi:hypothetical protein